MFDAARIFDMGQDDFYVAVEEPEGAEAFHEKHILPAGDAVDSEYGYIIGRYQRNAFVLGFNSAMQLFMSCVGQSGVIEPQIDLSQKDEDDE